MLDELVARHYIARWQFSGPSASGFPDDVDTELWSEGKGATFELLLDDDPTMQAAILLQEGGTRFYPQYVGSILQAAIEDSLLAPFPSSSSSSSSSSPPAAPPPPVKEGRVTWEEYYVDPRRSADPDLFEPRQVLMEWTLQGPQQ